MTEELEYISESGIVFPVPVPGLNLVASISPDTSDELTILQRHENVLVAKQLAEAEYLRFFLQFERFIRQSTHTVLYERFADYGQVGYLIRVTVCATKRKMNEIKQWTEEHIRSDGVI